MKYNETCPTCGSKCPKYRKFCSRGCFRQSDSSNKKNSEAHKGKRTGKDHHSYNPDMVIPNKTCLNCGIEFTKKHRRAENDWEKQKTCSAKCGHELRKKENYDSRLAKACKFCEQTFKSQGRLGNGAIYCSIKCHNAAKGILTRECLLCKKVYKPNNNNSAQKYCSHKCSEIGSLGARPERYIGAIKTKQGYTMVRISDDSPYVSLRNKIGYVLEHRLVMSEMIGRAMAATEQVHHKDGVRSNNNSSNLELRVGNHGSGATHHCPTCTCGKQKVETVYMKNFEFN